MVTLPLSLKPLLQRGASRFAVSVLMLHLLMWTLGRGPWYKVSRVQMMGNK